jgi:hypothetical protein
MAVNQSTEVLRPVQAPIVTTVDFHGDVLQAVKLGESEKEVYVSAKRVCESLGLGWGAQFEKLQKAEWATVSMIETVAEDGKLRQLAMISLESLTMWLATIQASRVAEHARPKLVAYQRECVRVLAEHFLGQRVPARELSDLRQTTAILDARTQEMESGLARLANRLEEIQPLTGVKLASDATRQIHAAVLARHRNGLCPACERIVIVEDGALIRDSRVIHALPYRKLAGPTHTMPVCLPCFGQHTAQRLLDTIHDRVSAYLTLVDSQTGPQSLPF